MESSSSGLNPYIPLLCVRVCVCARASSPATHIRAWEVAPYPAFDALSSFILSALVCLLLRFFPIKNDLRQHQDI